LLEEYRERLLSAIYDRAVRHWSASLAIKIALIVGGSCLAGLAQFLSIPEGQPISIWGAIGVLSVVAAALGGLYVAIVDADASKELALAHEAVEQARAFEDALDESLKLFENESTSLSRAIELYQAMFAMRGAIERVVHSTMDDEKICQTLIDVAERSLQVALDFHLNEHWTLTIYKSERDASGRRYLHAKATTRSVKCALTDARKLPEGVGVAGICLAKAEEVIVPDMSASRVGNMHELGAVKLPHDATRYRSLAAAPILVGNASEPWGVICATSDRTGHFKPDGEPGVRTDEAIRALAGMVALAIATHQKAAS
jgi:hypothetical protein